MPFIFIFLFTELKYKQCFGGIIMKILINDFILIIFITFFISCGSGGTCGGGKSFTGKARCKNGALQILCE